MGRSRSGLIVRSCEPLKLGMKKRRNSDGMVRGHRGFYLNAGSQHKDDAADGKDPSNLAHAKPIHDLSPYILDTYLVE